MSVRFRTSWSVNSNRNQSVKWIMNMINQWAQFIDKVRPGFSRHSARFRGNIPRFISHKAKQVHFKGNIPCPLSHQAKEASFNKLQPFPCHWCILLYSIAQKKVTTLSQDANCLTYYAILVACYTILVVQDTILVARDGLKTVSTIVSWPKFLSDFKNRW